jgi:phosphoglycerate dehydrogenase-like enzyme
MTNAAASSTRTIVVLAEPLEMITPALAPLAARARVVCGRRSADLGPALKDAEALFAWGKPHEPFGEILRRAPRLRWLHSTGAGVEHLLVPELVARPIVLTNSRGLYADSIAEYALALMLAHAKRLPETFAAQREHHWAPGPTHDLVGSTLVVVGLGSIGAALARRARALGLRVLGVRRGGRPAASLAERVYGVDDLASALPQANYLAICCPETAETRGLIGARELALLPPGAFLVNVARGSVVDEAALIAALRSGHLGGAGLDVYATEPLPPTSPLWDLPNVIVSPHQSGMAIGWDARAIRLFLENTDRFLTGRRLRNVVPKQRGY